MNIRSLLKNNIRFSRVGLFLLASLLYVSCDNNEDIANNGMEPGLPIPVEVSLGGINEFSANGTVASRSIEPQTQTIAVPFGEEMALVNIRREDAAPQTRAVTPLNAGVKFRVLAYLNSVSTSNFKASADYEVLEGGGVSLIAGGLNLSAGTYQFVCYSYNNSATLPDFDGAQHTVVTGIPNGTDFIRAQVSQAVSGNSQTLNISFYHVCSQLKVRVDASGTGSNVTSSLATLSGLENSTASWDVTTSVLSVQSGAALDMQFIWNAPAAQVVDSDPKVLMPLANKKLTLNFTNITVGDKAYTNKKIVLEGVTLTQGNSYTCTVTFVSGGQGGGELGGNGDGANCYVVAPEGTYSLLAKYQGNTEVSVGIGRGAKVVWQSAQNLITNVAYNNGVIYFKSGGQPGNAVIAVTDGTNGTGNILWSWHIWVTEYNPDAESGQGMSPSGRIFMKRNLGAISETPGDTYSRGNYYQWGRKEPFAGPMQWNPSGYYKSWRSAIYDASNTLIPASTQAIRVRQTLAESIQNPLKFFLGDGGTWLSTLQTQGLWTDGLGEKKSVYDPCPKGWRVPRMDDFNSLTEANFPKNSYGRTNSNIGYVPYAGCAYEADGYAWPMTDRALYQTTKYHSSHYAYQWYIDNNNATYPHRADGQAMLCVVRCVKDWAE